MNDLNDYIQGIAEETLIDLDDAVFYDYENRKISEDQCNELFKANQQIIENNFGIKLDCEQIEICDNKIMQVNSPEWLAEIDRIVANF